jgi:hypothetical protein
MLNTHAVLFLGLPGRTGKQAKVLERLSGCHPILQEPEDISQASQEDLTQDEIEQIELETRLGELERNFRDMATESSVKLGYCNPLVSLPGNEMFDSVSKHIHLTVSRLMKNYRVLTMKRTRRD